VVRLFYQSLFYVKGLIRQGGLIFLITSNTGKQNNSYKTSLTPSTGWKNKPSKKPAGGKLLACGMFH
jgi:hypothetical protein